jgi:hypothetical protein
MPARRPCTKVLRGSRETIGRTGLQNLGLQFLSTKRLLDEKSNASVFGLNNLFYRRIGSHHDEGQIRVLFAGGKKLTADVIAKV